MRQEQALLVAVLICEALLVQSLKIPVISGTVRTRCTDDNCSHKPYLVVGNKTVWLGKDGTSTASAPVTCIGNLYMAHFDGITLRGEANVDAVQQDPDILWADVPSRFSAMGSLPPEHLFVAGTGAGQNFWIANPRTADVMAVGASRVNPSCVNDVTALDVGNIFIGGCFVHAGSVRANGVAHLDPRYGWRALGTGLRMQTGEPGVAYTLSATSDFIVVGGDFYSAGNLTRAQGVAVWDMKDEEWSNIGGGLDGGVPGVVHSVAQNSNGAKLFVGGHFKRNGVEYVLASIYHATSNPTWTFHSFNQGKVYGLATSLAWLDNQLLVAGSMSGDDKKLADMGGFMTNEAATDFLPVQLPGSVIDLSVCSI